MWPGTAKRAEDRCSRREKDRKGARRLWLPPWRASVAGSALPPPWSPETQPERRSAAREGERGARERSGRAALSSALTATQRCFRFKGAARSPQGWRGAARRAGRGSAAARVAPGLLVLCERPPGQAGPSGVGERRACWAGRGGRATRLRHRGGLGRPCGELAHVDGQAWADLWVANGESGAERRRSESLPREGGMRRVGVGECVGVGVRGGVGWEWAVGGWARAARMNSEAIPSLSSNDCRSAALLLFCAREGVGRERAGGRGGVSRRADVEQS